MLVAYVSGHGFGHATRTAEVLAAARALEPSLPVTVVTAAPARLFQDVPGTIACRPRTIDVGLVQRGALVIDEAATAARWRAFADGYARAVEEESRWLRAAGARVVLGDLPPLAFDAAAEAGVPALGLANFGWDWIYRHLAARRPELGAAAAHAAAACARATLLLALPFAGGLEAFPRREDIPLVARRPRVARAEVRRRLGLEGGPLVLWSFGGLGLPDFDARVLGPLARFRFLLSDGDGPLPANATRVTTEGLEGAGLAYIDLLGAVDAVVTKPGYGIVADAIGARVPMVYTERGDFPEYGVMVREMPAWLPCRHVEGHALRAGRLAEALEAVLGAAWPAPRATDGARVAAERLLAYA
jgi:L-arabinokinase